MNFRKSLELFREFICFGGSRCQRHQVHKPLHQVYQLKHQVHQSPVSSNQQYHFLCFLVNNSVNNIPDNLTTTTVGMVFIGLYLSGDDAFSKIVLELKSFKSIHEHPADTNTWPKRSFLHPIQTRLFRRTDSKICSMINTCIDCSLLLHLLLSPTCSPLLLPPSYPISATAPTKS